jgi:hypothetical protein
MKSDAVSRGAAPVTPLPQPPEERWLLWYVRGLAFVFLTAGLMHWQPILGTPNVVPLNELSTAKQIFTCYLAVVCLVAAVGLWIGASWGTVIWLLAALSQVVAHVGLRDIFGAAWGLVGFHIAAMAVYVVIAWRVAQIRDE